MSSTTFRPKRIKLEILRSSSPSACTGAQLGKLIPINIKSTGQQLQGKLCNLIPIPKPVGFQSMMKLDNEDFFSDMSRPEFNTSLDTSLKSIPGNSNKNPMINTPRTIKTFPNPGIKREQETPQMDPIPKSLPTESDAVVSLSDDTSECSTEADPQELERLKNEFIEEASVLNDDVMDDLNEFFVNPPIISDESHERMVKEILEDRIDSFTKDCIQHQIKLVDAECQTETQALSVTKTSITNISPSKPDEESPKTSTEDSSQTNVNKEILNYLKRMDKRLNNIEIRLTKIEDRYDPTFFLDDEDEESEQDDQDEELDKLLSLKFPLKTIKDLDVLDETCKVPRMKAALEQKFKQYSGLNEIDTINKILRQLVELPILNLYKWRQTDQKRSFETFKNINKLIFDCVKHHFRLFSVTEYARQMNLILNRSKR